MKNENESFRKCYDYTNSGKVHKQKLLKCQSDLKKYSSFSKGKVFFAESTKKTLKHLSSLLISNGYLHTEYRVAFRTQSNT